MKVVKSISLFFIYPLFVFILGLAVGAYYANDFYPQKKQEVKENRVNKISENDMEQEEGFLDAASLSKVLCSDTKYILEETDMLKNTVVETTWKLPAKYIGMNRDQFIEAMRQYEANPPLAERERGFESLEVVSFSGEQVIVKMNYHYVQPGKAFYLSVKDNEVIVLLEDKKTIYINTGIRLEQLPDNLRIQIVDMIYIENEGKLYDFLENYSS